MTSLPPTIADADVTLTYAGVQPGVSAGEYFGYCTIDDVFYEFADLSSYTELTDTTAAPAMNGKTRVAMEITGAAMELQAELNHFYEMPYTGSDGNILLMLRDMNTKLAVARLIERFFMASEPNRSEAGIERKQYVAEIFHSIASGAVRWDVPFGDAVARSMLPTYDRASALSVTPSPYANDGSQNPIFSVTGQTRFDRDAVM